MEERGAAGKVSKVFGWIMKNTCNVNKSQEFSKTWSQTRLEDVAIKRSTLYFCVIYLVF
jgi:hypothetical protein